MDQEFIIKMSSNFYYHSFEAVIAPEHLPLKQKPPRHNYDCGSNAESDK